MFNTTHIIYIIASLVGTAGVVAGLSFIKGQKAKEIILKACALLTFIIHISIMWVDYLKNGRADAPDYILFPKYFCNFCMYVLLAAAFVRNKEGKVFRVIAEFVAYGGTVGALVTIFYSDYLAGDPYFSQYITIKSLLSHNTMMIGCLYLFVGGFIKPRVSNLISLAAGLLATGAVGGLMIGLFAVCGRDIPNAMYLIGTAVDGVPILNGYFIALLMVLLVFAFTALFEQFALTKEERWYSKLSRRFAKKAAQE